MKKFTFMHTPSFTDRSVHNKGTGWACQTIFFPTERLENYLTLHKVIVPHVSKFSVISVHVQTTNKRFLWLYVRQLNQVAEALKELHVAAWTVAIWQYCRLVLVLLNEWKIIKQRGMEMEQLYTYQETRVVITYFDILIPFTVHSRRHTFKQVFR